MRYLKKFEAEIYVGTWQHYNGLRPVNQQIFDENPIVSFICNDCNFEFATEDTEQDWCSVCLSKNIEKTK